MDYASPWTLEHELSTLFYSFSYSVNVRTYHKAYRLLVHLYNYLLCTGPKMTFHDANLIRKCYLHILPILSDKFPINFMLLFPVQFPSHMKCHILDRISTSSQSNCHELMCQTNFLLISCSYFLYNFLHT